MEFPGYGGEGSRLKDDSEFRSPFPTDFLPNRSRRLRISGGCASSRRTRWAYIAMSPSAGEWNSPATAGKEVVSKTTPNFGVRFQRTFFQTVAGDFESPAAAPARGVRGGHISRCPRPPGNGIPRLRRGRKSSQRRLRISESVSNGLSSKP